MRSDFMLSFIFVACCVFSLNVFAQTTSTPAIPSSIAAPEAVVPSGLPTMMQNADGTGLVVARAQESFSEITLEGSALVAMTPLPGSRELRPTFVRELYQLRWRPNDAIDLYVIRPVGIANPPVVLYLYGYPTETTRFKDDRWCERATGNGAAAVGFVSALTGHRDEFRPLTENFVTQMPEALAATTHDVQLVLDYLQSRKDLDMNRVGMFGQGSGGAVAVLAAAADPRIKALDLLDPWGAWPSWFATSQAFPESERATFLKPDFQQELQPLEPVKYLPRLSGIKMRIQFDEDQADSKDAMEKLDQAAPKNATVLRYPSARRMYSANAGGRLFDWIATQLDAKPAAPRPAGSQTANMTLATPNAPSAAAPAQPKP